jgi:hypothetical protein
MLSKHNIMNSKIQENSMTQVNMVTVQARLRPWVTCSLWDKEGVKYMGGKNRRMTVELNIYTLTYAE